MMHSRMRLAVALIGCSLVLLPMGCENLPGTSRSQGAVIGGAAGALAGGAIAKNNRLLGALIGAALGAGGGYLIGTTLENAKADPEAQEAAKEAARNAQENPATVEDVQDATTADLNSDGFVTMDEVLAMHQAGLGQDEMIRRLEATGQVFELSPEQEDYLAERGISRSFIARMEDVNAQTKDRFFEQQGSDRGDRRSDVIGDIPTKTSHADDM
ncbi:MAG TPA: glycine zipper 2TM domain-containing protein [Planctomycetota bacterium]|nr:glycine zipper 2TM domain-containing protein [Planctomycetota bacterium]